ncbi:MAG TPA: AMP-binding protein [Acetobacteraceae bacterium]|jgi:fatty-acyl-CoA synthase|nr:AMP-binding protein [Acetobacteraceae bacterium]
MATSTRSYLHRTAETPLLDDTLGGALDKAAERWPDQEALVVRDQGVRLTYSALRHQVDRLAAGLIALGLKPGDRVGLWSPNRVEWVLTQYATAKAGLILVNINPAYRAAELEYALNKVECRALITADRFKTTDYIEILRELAPELADCAPGGLRAARLPHLTTVAHFADTDEPGYYRFAEIAALGGPAEYARLAELSGLLQPDDPINIQFTSGTTGSPKAATLTHHGLLNNAYFFGLMSALKQGDRYCNPLPLYHVGGMVMGSIGGIVLGMTIVYLGEAFDPFAALEAIQAERCSHFGGVPTMMIAVLNHPAFRQFDKSSLRGGFSGGSPVPSDVVRRAIDDMNMGEMICVYGMTELSGSSVQNTSGDTFAQRVGTIGRVQPHMEVKIADLEGRAVPLGTQGELCFRGFMVMRGYWGDPARTRETIDESRWLHSGDLGVMDADGFITITGRSKDMVIRGGENIYPREVEEFLFKHPAVADAQVFGIPDERFGEELCAWIKLKPGAAATEDDVRGFCRGQITHFKIPRYVRFVDQYPMTVTGKVQKFVMREMMARELASAAVQVR